MSDSNMHEVEFQVTLCYGGGDGGDICVTVDVTDEEYELLKQCCREDEDISDYEELEDLVARIEAEAKGEDYACRPDSSEDEDEDDYEEDYDDVTCMIQLPDEIYDLINEEEYEEPDEDE